MKKELFLLLSVTFLTTACAETTTVEVEETPSTVEEIVEEEVVEEEPSELLEPGDQSTQDGAQVTLLEIYTPEGEHSLREDLKLSFDSIKFLRIDDMDEYAQEFYSSYDINPGDTAIQLVYYIHNDTGEILDSGINYPTIVTSNGEQIDVNTQLPLGAFESHPGARTETGFIAKIKQPEGIESFTMTFDLWNLEGPIDTNSLEVTL